MAPRGYTDLFQTRGDKYESAMQQFPHARDHEFQQAADLASFTQKDTILDVPAGGGYLQSYLSSNHLYHAHEPCSTFGHSTNDSANDLLPLPHQDEAIDITFSIAGVHHIQNKPSLFNEIARVTPSQGQLILADVHKHSAVASFLDDFVGSNNSTGHDGIYIDETTLDVLDSSGWQVISANRKPVYWSFNDESAMANFCRSLFDLRSLSNEAIISAINELLGINHLDGKVNLNWELFYIAAIRK
ncbi:hypothetical protein A9Q79_01010 [Methylophaga sp. 42_25_T18]|nr:hypothetical protein A9Q79_01010 [Methylophaga sp. 42_25_T18]